MQSSTNNNDFLYYSLLFDVPCTQRR